MDPKEGLSDTWLLSEKKENEPNFFGVKIKDENSSLGFAGQFVAKFIMGTVAVIVIATIKNYLGKEVSTVRPIQPQTEEHPLSKAGSRFLEMETPISLPSIPDRADLPPEIAEIRPLSIDLGGEKAETESLSGQEKKDEKK